MGKIPKRKAIMHNFNLTETEWAYMAGIIDGEGWISVKTLPRKHGFILSPIIAVQMKSKEILDWISQKFYVPFQPRSSRTHIMRRKDGKVVLFGWVKYGFIVYPILKGLLPYLKLKKKHALKLLDFIEMRLPKSPHDPYSEEEIKVVRELRMLNESKNPKLKRSLEILTLLSSQGRLHQA